MNKKLFIPLGVFLVLVGFLFVGLFLNPREVPSPLIGKPAPQFTLNQLHQPGKTLGTPDMKGQVWLLNVWASWCVSCREEHPLLVAAARQNLVPIVGLNHKDEAGAATAWLRRLGNPYQAIAVDRDGRVSIDYGVYGVPETFVIDRDGIVRMKHIGPLTPEVWAKDLLPLVNRLKG